MLRSTTHISIRSQSSRGQGFGTGLKDLREALNADLDWLREHTRYLRLAKEWEEVGKPSDGRLLSAADIALANKWRVAQPKNASPPTDLQLEFVKASEAEDVRRQSAELQRLRDIAEAQDAREKALIDKADAQAAREKALADAQEAQKREAIALKREAEGQRREAEAQKQAAEQARRFARRLGLALAAVVAFALVAVGFGLMA